MNPFIFQMMDLKLLFVLALCLISFSDSRQINRWFGSRQSRRIDQVKRDHLNQLLAGSVDQVKCDHLNQLLAGRVGELIT